MRSVAFPCGPPVLRDLLDHGVESRATRQAPTVPPVGAEDSESERLDLATDGHGASLDRGAAHGLFASAPVDCLHTVSHFEPAGGPFTAPVCATVRSWIALVRSRLCVELVISSAFCRSLDCTIHHSWS